MLVGPIQNENICDVGIPVVYGEVYLTPQEGVFRPLALLQLGQSLHDGQTGPINVWTVKVSPVQGADNADLNPDLAKTFPMSGSGWRMDAAWLLDYYARSYYADIKGPRQHDFEEALTSFLSQARLAQWCPTPLVEGSSEGSSEQSSDEPANKRARMVETPPRGGTRRLVLSPQ